MRFLLLWFHLNIRLRSPFFYQDICWEDLNFWPTQAATLPNVVHDTVDIHEDRRGTNQHHHDGPPDKPPTAFGKCSPFARPQPCRVEVMTKEEGENGQRPDQRLHWGRHLQLWQRSLLIVIKVLLSYYSLMFFCTIHIYNHF